MENKKFKENRPENYHVHDSERAVLKAVLKAVLRAVHCGCQG